MKRPAYCYTKPDRPPYTRKEYIRGGPDPKIRIFEMGTPNKEFEIELRLIALEDCQVTANALEAARIQINRVLSRNLGKEGYHYKIHPYPHQRLRENKMLTGAGADRLQSGMKKAFGKVIGRAARVRAGDVILSVRCNKDGYKIAKNAIRLGRYKFPTPCRVIVTKGQELVE